MAKLEILEIPNPILRKKSQRIETINKEIIELLDNMLETMYLASGVGLAAPQTGHLLRMIVVDVSGKDSPKQPLFAINPEILSKSEELSECEEGCLSVPHQYAKVSRPSSVIVKYQDKEGTEHIIEASGFFAIALQHEIDHLDGKIFTDYLSPLKRKMLLKKLEKERKNNSEGSED